METYKKGLVKKKNLSEKIDSVITGKYLGFPVFILFLSLMFFSTFSLGNYPKHWIEQLVLVFSSYIETILPAGTLNDLITDGIIDGVGGVIVFLPNILILFLFISFMEDTGYMARVAFIMDRIMHKIGLHGKSFIPMMMGFGCTVPAIMATRTIENRNDRLLTMLITPFMSCSARLPVYVLIISAFFPKYPALMLLLVYFSGIFLAVIFGIIFKKTMFRSKEAPFVMELPPYRMPTLRSTFKHMWNRASQYLKKIGGVILLASIIIWALEYYPKNVDYSKNFDSEIKSKSLLLASSEFQDSAEIKKINNEITLLEIAKQSEHVEKSYIGIIGKAIEPVLRPLGFDWKMGISLLTGIAGKEVVVSTMAILYQTDNNTDEHSSTLQYKLQNEKYSSGPRKGENVFNPLIAFAFLIFILIYFPCVAVIAVLKKESGKWKWALFVVFYTTGVAWLMSFLVYQIGSLFI
jgi:ferrous iron transport protein B